MHTLSRLRGPHAGPLAVPRDVAWRIVPSSDADPALVRARARARVRRELRRRWRSALATGMKVGVLLLAGWGLLFNLSVVRGSSMSPGIHDGDRIVVDHLSYVLGSAQRGDIAVLRYPVDPTVDYIKRVIGVPGDVIRIEGGAVWVNGRRLDEPYVAAQDPRTRLATTVPADAYFVLGDNRTHSSDSREFGFVPRTHLVGKVDLRVWPPARLGLLD